MGDAAMSTEGGFEASFLADSGAAHRVREEFERYLAGRGLGEGEIHDLALALQEALDNVVEHAYRDAGPGLVAVEASVEGGSVVVVVRDQGPEFDPLTVPPPEAGGTLDGLRAGGFGVHLIRRLCDEVRWERRAGKNHLVLVRHLARE